MTLADAGVVVLDCLHKTPVAVDIGYPYVTIPEMSSGHLQLEAARRISRKDFVEWTRKAAPQAHDVVLSRRCNPGETACVPPETEFALGQNLVLLRATGPHVYPPFLRWLGRSPAWWEQIRVFLNVGDVFDSLRIRDIPSFKLPVPPHDDQRRITSILGALDDKIELNRRMNETLEALARAIFQSWFVAFDPVIAKSEGRQPFGMNAETAALFPDSFQDSPLGPIPKGWGTGPILEHARLLSGGTPKTSVPEYWGGEIHWASAADVSQCADPLLIANSRNITDRGLNESATRLIPQFSTVIVARGATTGRMCMLGREMAMNQTCYALASKRDTPFFVYCLAESAMDDLVHMAYGSVFDTITTRTFEGSRVIVPSLDTARAFDGLVTPMSEALLGNQLESATLAKTRDTLLPKLLSGEIRTKHAQELTEAAV